MKNVLGMSDLSPHEKLVLSTLAWYDGPGGCWPAIETIADHLKLHRTTVARHIRSLRKKGRLTSKRKGQAVNLYTIHYGPADVAPVATLENAADVALGDARCSTTVTSDVAPGATRTGFKGIKKESFSQHVDHPSNTEGNQDGPPREEDFLNDGKSNAPVDEPRPAYTGKISDWLKDNEIDRLRAEYPDVDTIGSFKDFDLFYHGQTIRNPWAAVLSHLKTNPRQKLAPVVDLQGNHVPQPQHGSRPFQRADNPEYHKHVDQELADMLTENEQRRNND